LAKYLYFLAFAACFALGANFWRLRNTGAAQLLESGQPAAAPVAATDAPGGKTPADGKAPADGGAQGKVDTRNLSPGAVVIEVGQEKVTVEDLEWEYDLVTSELKDKDTLTAIPDLGNRLHQELAPLKRALVSNVIERKLLYSFLQQDKTFDFQDPKRFAACLGEWQQSVSHASSFTPRARDRLKARLCERSVIDQYMREKLFAQVDVSDAETLEYYKNHSNEFHLPERVEIRHLVVPNEDEAKKWHVLANPHNFAEIAKAHSIAPEAENGGKLGPFAKGTFPSVFDYAFHMHKGQISEVLKSTYGYHLILLLEKYPKREMSLTEAKAKIDGILRKKREEEAYKKWVDRALASITVSTPTPLW
jgi:peptidyl-prolyl cis-trans isomerase C